ncbi:MAG TPA: hypothetical protein VFL04_02115, partial [Rectinemataceae bacterium]|nr:hypothetical protein [Rectinemataceae bacterium]
LFSEEPGRFLVSVRPEDRERFERSVGPAQYLGEVTREARVEASLAGESVISADLGALERAFKTAIVQGE